MRAEGSSPPAYPALAKAVDLAPSKIIDIIRSAGLRGLGGAGFPTAQKWEAVLKAPGDEKRVIMNADESEPGTFKDRLILETSPHLAIEGLLIAMKATGAGKGHIYIRKEYGGPYRSVKKALALVPPHARDLARQVKLFRSPGGYICGEESALIQTMNMARAEPSVRPPYPASKGLGGLPTLVNNVETLAMAAAAVEKGGARFARSWEKLVCVSGDVMSPGAYPAGKGASLRQIIYGRAGGPSGDGFKFALVGGYSGFVASEEDLDNIILAEPSSFGAGAVIVMNNSRSALRAARNIAGFFRDESCGKCAPCREGTVVVEDALRRLKKGGGGLEELGGVIGAMRNASLCGLGKTATRALEGLRKKFPGEFA